LEELDAATPRNGDRYVSYREFNEARRADEREHKRDREMQLLSLEERVMAALNQHVAASERGAKAQDDRIHHLADGLDKINSLLDQQRGATNLLKFVVGASLLGAIASVGSLFAVAAALGGGR
jgi:hypothetical protein